MNNENLKEHSHNHEHEHSHRHEHCHNHQHSHSHSNDEEHYHGDNHEHEHKCESAIDSLSKEEKTLKLLLSHWIDHNKSHEKGFEEWVEKSKKMEKVETADFIEKAIEFMKKADEMLLEAQKHM